MEKIVKDLLRRRKIAKMLAEYSALEEASATYCTAVAKATEAGERLLGVIKQIKSNSDFYDAFIHTSMCAIKEELQAIEPQKDQEEDDQTRSI